MKDRVKAWDLPTRLFHWTLLVLFVCGWLSFKFGDATLSWHSWNGYALLTLLLFRLAWGVVGGSTSRFARFVVSPWRALAYLGDLARGRAEHHLGHNPAGGWMVVVLLAVLLAMTVCGLFASDDIMSSGPLAHLVRSSTVGLLTGLHKKLFWGIVALVAIHVAAVLYHQLGKGDRLVQAMVTGTKPAHQAPAGQSARPAPAWAAPVCLAGSAGALAALLALVG